MSHAIEAVERPCHMLWRLLWQAIWDAMGPVAKPCHMLCHVTTGLVTRYGACWQPISHAMEVDDWPCHMLWRLFTGYIRYYGAFDSSCHIYRVWWLAMFHALEPDDRQWKILSTMFTGHVTFCEACDNKREQIRLKSSVFSLFIPIEWNQVIDSVSIKLCCALFFKLRYVWYNLTDDFMNPMVKHPSYTRHLKRHVLWRCCTCSDDICFHLPRCR